MSRADQNSGRSTSGDEYVPHATATRSTHTKHTTSTTSSTVANATSSAPDAEGVRKKRRKSGEVVRAFACQLCTKRYGTRAALSLHFKLKHELPLPLTSWNELQAARDVELAYGPMVNDTVEAFVADKHGEMSQRAVVRTAALACILGRTTPANGAATTPGGNSDASNDVVDVAIDLPTTAQPSTTSTTATTTTTNARKRVRIVEPVGVVSQCDEQPTISKISLPPLAVVLSTDLCATPSSPPQSVAALRVSPPPPPPPPRAALPPLQSLVPAKSSGATATFLVDVEFFKLPPLVSPQSTGGTN